MKQRKFIFPLVTALIIMAGCFSPVTTDLEYNPEYLGPIAYAHITPAEFAETIEPAATYQYTAADLGVQIGVPVIVPPIGPIDLPPRYNNVSDYINTVSANEASFSIHFENNLPITISQGTRLVAFDSATQDVFFDHALTQDVASGETYENTAQAQNKTLTSNWGMQIKDFRSPGGQDVTFEGDTTTVSVTLQIVDFLEATITPDESFEFNFNTPVNFSFMDSLSANEISGFLSLFFENYLPSSLDIKMDLKDNNNTTVYSFFNGQSITIPSPVIDGQGYPQEVEYADFPEIISLDELQQVQNVTQLSVTMKLQSPPNSNVLTVDDSSFFDLKLSAKASAKFDIQ